MYSRPVSVTREPVSGLASLLSASSLVVSAVSVSATWGVAGPQAATSKPSSKAQSRSRVQFWALIMLVFSWFSLWFMVLTFIHVFTNDFITKRPEQLDGRSGSNNHHFQMETGDCITNSKDQN
jgi:hypothetical protein